MRFQWCFFLIIIVFCQWVWQGEKWGCVFLQLWLLLWWHNLLCIHDSKSYVSKSVVRSVNLFFDLSRLSRNSCSFTEAMVSLPISYILFVNLLNSQSHQEQSSQCLKCVEAVSQSGRTEVMVLCRKCFLFILSPIKRLAHLCRSQIFVASQCDLECLLLLRC